MRRSSPFRIGAVILAVGLTGSYVWFRAAQAQERDRQQRLLPGSKVGHVRVGAGSTTTAASRPTLLPGSKSMILTEPAARADGTGAPEPATAPATSPRVLFYGSKSAPVDLSPALKPTGKAELPMIATSPTAATAPATQPGR